MSRHGRQERRPHRGQSGAHLADYMAVVKNHLPLATFVFLAILVGMSAKTLYSKPVYRSEAIVQIDERGAQNGLLGDLAALEGNSTTDAEMEVMRAHRVAKGAAELLSPDDFLIEENACRPLEMLLREAGLRRLPDARVRVETEPVKEGGEGDTYLFAFGRGSGGELSLSVGNEGDDGETAPVAVQGFASGRPFDFGGRTFTFHVEGDPAGRRYSLSLRPADQTALWIQGKVAVAEIGRRTGVVSLGFQAETPELAQKVAQALARSYVRYKQEVKQNQADRAVKFLLAESTRVGGDLRAAEDALDRYRTDSNATLLTDRARVIVTKVTELELQRAELGIERAELERRLADLGTEVGFAQAMLSLDSASADPMTAELAADLARHELELERSLADDVTERHPRIQRLRADIEASRQRLRANLQTSLSARLDGISHRLEGIGEAISRYEADAKALPQTERRITELTRDVEGNLQIYAYLREKMQEAQIAQASTLAAMRIVDDALLPTSRVSPNLLKQVLIASFLALVAALAAAFFAEYLDRSIKSPQELEEGVGVPLYAALPAFRSIRSRSARKLKSALVTVENPNSVLAENYRTLRANIRFANLERPLRTFAITSSVLGEGKTITTLNLAVALAQGGSKVVVVDADMRRPATHAHFGAPLAPGLEEVLAHGRDWREVIRETPVAGLKVIHAGKKPSHPGALLDSERFHRLLAELKESFEYVLVDVPPVLAVSDSASFFRELDGVFLLARYKLCALEVVIGAKEQIERLGANLVGVIYNGFDARKSVRKGYGYYGYYGYYGRYGKYGGYGYGYGHGDESTRSRRGRGPQEEAGGARNRVAPASVAGAGEEER